MSPVIIILAGGRATRMGGGDKPLIPFDGTTLLGHMLDRLAGQGAAIAINANGDPARYAEFGLAVVADSVPGWPGPLAGVLAGMEWADAEYPDADDIVSVPGDTPFVPCDLVARLVEGRGGAQIAVAQSASRRHPVAALWPVRLQGALRRAITRDGARRVEQWQALHRVASVEFSADPVDPFFNVNYPEDLETAERLARAHPEA